MDQSPWSTHWIRAWDRSPKHRKKRKLMFKLEYNNTIPYLRTKIIYNLKSYKKFLKDMWLTKKNKKLSIYKVLYRVQGKSTYEWHTDDIRVHKSDIRMTYEYIRVTYGWHTSTYEWHTDDIQGHTSDIRMTWVHTSNIRMTYEYIRVTYGWHTSTYCFGLCTKIKKGSGISFWCTFSAWVFHANAPYQ